MSVHVRGDTFFKLRSLASAGKRATVYVASNIHDNEPLTRQPASVRSKGQASRAGSPALDCARLAKVAAYETAQFAVYAEAIRPHKRHNEAYLLVDHALKSGN